MFSIGHMSEYYGGDLDEYMTLCVLFAGCVSSRKCITACLGFELVGSVWRQCGEGLCAGSLQYPIIKEYIFPS